MDIPAVRIFDIVGIPKATAEKKVASKETISGAGGQAALGLARLLAISRGIVDNSTAAEAKDFDVGKWLGQWIERPQPALGGRKPADLISTPTGLDMVARVLGAIESGLTSDLVAYRCRHEKLSRRRPDGRWRSEEPGALERCRTGRPVHRTDHRDRRAGDRLHRRWRPPPIATWLRSPCRPRHGPPDRLDVSKLDITWAAIPAGRGSVKAGSDWIRGWGHGAPRRALRHRARGACRGHQHAAPTPRASRRASFACLSTTGCSGA